MPIAKPKATTADVLPFVAPQADPNPRAVIGSNQAPLEERIPAEFRTAVIEERADFYQKLEDLLGKAATDTEEAKSGSVDRAKCKDEDTLVGCGKLVKTLRACKLLVESVHDKVKAPYWDAGKLVTAEKNLLVGQFVAAIAKVESMQKAYFDDLTLKAKQKQDQDDADRAKLVELARENNLEDALPPPPPPIIAAIPVAGAPLRTDGATISAGKEWKSAVEDYAKAFKHVKDDAGVRAAIDKAIQTKVKATKGNANKPLAGVRMWEDTKVSNR